MKDYQNMGHYLLEWMEDHWPEKSEGGEKTATTAPAAANYQPYTPPEPVGWRKRNRFGIEMRYWPKLNMAIDFEARVKIARGIPRNYLHCYIDHMEPKNFEQAQVMNAMNVMVTIPDNPLYFLLVCGGNGTGKTYLGCGVVNTLTRLSTAYDHDTLAQYDWEPLFVNEADLLMRISGFNDNAQYWFNQYTEVCRFLVIDEFGMTQWTESDKKKIERLLFKRHANRLRTVILSNLSQGEINEIISPTLKSRLKEKGKTFNFTGGDLRGSMSDSDLGKYWNESAEPDDPF